MIIKRMLFAFTTAFALAAGSSAVAAAECQNIRFGQVSWTGVSAKTEMAAWMLERLGYDVNVLTASLPLMFQGVSSDELDAFFGFWVPSSRSMASPYMKKGSIDLVSPNLREAKYTVAVPTYVHAAGVKSFADLDEHKEKFGGKIYGIEAGNDGNQIIQSLIDDNAYGLGDWELVPSSESGMLAMVSRRTADQEWIAFLGWAPHPMNINFDIKYLAGAANYWGPDKGEATVHTLAREGYAWQCPNVGQFLENYDFTVQEQSWLAVQIVNNEMGAVEAGRALIRRNPELLERWFGHGGTYVSGPVKTANGENHAKEVIAEELGLSDRVQTDAGD